MAKKTNAEKFKESGFFIAGVGHFNIGYEELQNVLLMIELGEYKLLQKYYEKLRDKYMGSDNGSFGLG